MIPHDIFLRVLNRATYRFPEPDYAASVRHAITAVCLWHLTPEERARRWEQLATLLESRMPDLARDAREAMKTDPQTA